MPQVQLSDESVVTFRPHYTHKAEREYIATLTEGVSFRTEIEKDADGNVVMDDETGMPKERTVQEGMKVSAATDAAEALISALILSIATKDGAAVPFTKEWLENLPQHDYVALEKQAMDMKKTADTFKAGKAKKS